MPELGEKNDPSTRLMPPEDLITAILSLPPDKPNVDFQTFEYFLEQTKEEF